MTDVLETQRDLAEEADYLGMESQRDKLIEIMESEFGLPEKLLKMRAFSHREVEKISYAVTREEKNEMILDFIRQNGKCQDLIKALSESFQTHLVNYINSNGVYKSEFGLDWPLTEREHEILNDNGEQLTEILDTCELLHKLCSKQVINVKQRNFISSRTSDQARNEALLRMIRRLSRASYLTLIQCLKESLQTHIADILENGGAIVPVHATVETDNLNETEEQIVDEMANLLTNMSPEQANRLLTATQLKIIAVKRGRSIVLYICCNNEDEFNRLCKMIDDSEMKKLLDQLFNLIIRNTWIKIQSVKIFERDLANTKQLFKRMKELKNKGTEGDSSFTSKSSSKFGRWFKNTFSFGRSNDSKRKIDNAQYADNDSSISQKPQSQPHKVKDSIDRHYAFLVDRMFPDFVLNEKLNEDLCITSTQIYAIKKKETARKKNELIIKYLIENHREEKLFEALDKSDQKHLVKYLENDGKYIETFGGDWPIMNKETLIIQSNHEAFVDLIESDDLTCLLYQTGVINRGRLNFVLSQSEPYEKSEALLEILKRCSLNSYWQIIRCLRHSKQCRIADILEKGGVVVRIDSKLKHINHLKTKETSAHIVTLINNIYNEIHGVKYERPLNEMLQLKLIGAKQHQDVSLYFLCNQSEEVDRLKEMAKDGRLKEFAESFFNQLKRIQEEIKVTLKWTPDIFTRSRALIQAIRIRVEEHISQWTPTSINSIPLELIDVIIQKSFSIFIRIKSQTDDGKFLDGFKQLAEVNVCWFKRVTKRRFKNYYWSYLSGIYERRNYVSTFWKNNRQFIEENVFQIITETNRLKSQDLLSDIECALIARKSSIVKKTQSSNKATDIALILNYKNETNLNLCREYFGVRHWIFEAMRNCGTSARIEINSQSPIEDKQITGFFKDSGSESLWSMKDRDFVRWIWCKSSAHKELQQSKNLRHPFSHLLEESPQRINEIRINLDSDQLMKRAVEISAEISIMEKKTISSIPLELIDIIIQKSFAIFIQMKSQTLDGKFLDGFKQLAEVNVCWFKRTTKRRIKNYCWSYLSGICERRNSISAFWKSNRQFIEETVSQIKTGANRLKHHDLLSDIQCALIARKSSTVKKSQASNKATDLSLILNYKDETIANLFSEYLRLSKRRRISIAMRNCGTSVRVEIRRNNRSLIEEEKIARFFEDSGSENLGTMRDRDFVRWIWCESTDSKELHQSKYLRHPFCHSEEESPQRINEIRINLDSDQQKKKAVVLPHIFDESLETINDQGNAVGVTKLRNEFYCLSYKREMKVFCDRYPFVLLRKFQFKKINEANDIVSCEKQNALYILGSREWFHICVWKSEQNSKTTQSEIKWLQLSNDFRPKTLSMSKSDQLLMFSETPSPSLRIYGPDAQLRLSISLSQYIKWPIHAVETSTGNFVILHLREEWDHLREKEDHLREKEDHLREKEDHLLEKEDHLREEEDHLREEEDHLREKEDHLREKEDHLREKEDHLLEKKDHLREEEDHLREKVEKEAKEKTEATITTLSRDGKTIVHNYQPENEEQRLRTYYSGFYYGYLSIDSNDRVFVTDSNNDRVILLDSNLHWNQILFPKSEGKDEDSGQLIPLYPRQLYYDEGKKQLVVRGLYGVEIVFLNKF